MIREDWDKEKCIRVLISDYNLNSHEAHGLMLLKNIIGWDIRINFNEYEGKHYFNVIIEDGHITEIHMADISYKEIEYLDLFPKLKVLEVSFTGLQKVKNLDLLENLEYLDLNNSYISKIEGLDNLINLKFLSFHCCNISEIEGLDNLQNLEILHLGTNNIKEIKNLDHLRNLTELDLNDNPITEIKGLKNLRNLKELWIECTSIKELKGLDNLINIEGLYLCRTEITKIDGLDQLLTKFKNIRHIQIDGLDLTDEDYKKYYDKFKETRKIRFSRTSFTYDEKRAMRESNPRPAG